MYKETTTKTVYAIKEIMNHLYESRDDLAKSKFSGVHLIDNVYRVHQSAFIPRVLDDDATSGNIEDIVQVCFSNEMSWDSQSLWLTMW